MFGGGKKKAAAAAAADAGKAGGARVGKKSLAWREVKPGLSVLCVPTHLLCHMDDPVSVVRRYVQRHAKPGDMAGTVQVRVWNCYTKYFCSQI
jgi:hypothetical protein